MNGTVAASGAKSPVAVVLLGGLVVGILDIADAITFWWFRAGVTPIHIFQSVATGLLGREAAASGGLASALLGAVLHFAIATSVVAACYFLGRTIPFIRQQPLMAGAIYGLGVFLVMYGVVMPLSRVGSPRWELGVPLVNNVLIHIFGVGMPSALFARRALISGSTAALAPSPEQHTSPGRTGPNGSA